MLPTVGAARIGSLVEAFAGVTATALAVGFPPSLCGASSSREQKFMMLDFLRRSIALFEESTCGLDLSGYEQFVVDPVSRDVNDSPLFLDLGLGLAENLPVGTDVAES